MRRSLLVPTLLALGWLGLPASPAAQLGSIKKKIVEKAPVTPVTPAQPAQGKAKPKCDASSIVITTDVADRYLKALAAGDAELAKLAREPGDVGRFYTAYNRRQAVSRIREDHRLHRRPAWERYRERQKVIMQRLMKGDPKASAELQALEEEVNPPFPTLPENAWESQRQGNARVETAMREAGGFSECDWQRVAGDPATINLIVGNLAMDGDVKRTTETLAGTATAAEIKAVNARLVELAHALGYSYTTEEDRRRLAADSVMLEKEAKQPILTGDPQTDCVNKAMAEFMEKHKAEFEAAQKKGDSAELIRLAQLQARAGLKCVPASDEDE